MKLVVGLGNPGKEYLHSRHNVGFRCIDHMAQKWGIKLAERRAKAVLGHRRIEQRLAGTNRTHRDADHGDDLISKLIRR